LKGSPELQFDTGTPPVRFDTGTPSVRFDKGSPLGLQIDTGTPPVRFDKGSPDTSRTSIEESLRRLLPREELYNLAIEIYENLTRSKSWKDTKFEQGTEPPLNINPKAKNEKFSSITIIYGYPKVCKRIGIDNNSSHFNDLYVKILKEIVLQIYAYNLIDNSKFKKIVEVPMVYGVSKSEEEGITYINIFMKYLEKIEVTNLKEKWREWNEQIKTIFEYFARNGLYHLDSGYRNVYFTTEGKLAIIDFGEAKNDEPNNETIFEFGQPSGYPIVDVDLSNFTRWFNGEKTSDFGTYGGKRTMRKRKTMRKRRKRKTRK